MFSLFDDQLIGDVVLRAEQSRASYNLQTEEFRNLNANLQNYLGNIKTVDDENRQLQENIEQIRTKYISTLENSLKRLPNDFHEQSQILTDAHIERYRFKSHTRRLQFEREEIKRRIKFVATNEKDQTKYLNFLQKQEQSIRNEFIKLNEQYQHLLKYVENEKQIHRQAMQKVDDLQIQLEQICIERSKTEFEIQTLKEEVKLMETTKEFLNDEREIILSTQTEANEYLLSCLNDSITYIRHDFEQLNQTQLQQIENEYQHILQTLEENFLSNNQTINTSQQNLQSDYEQLQIEHQSVLQELTTLNNHNQNLSQKILTMEANFYLLRNERIQQLNIKNNELEHSKISLQTLSEKLNHLAEYDRNLKFELTLYRGVLESEHKRKQSLINDNNNNNHSTYLIRPTTLKTNKNSMTDRTRWMTNNTNQSKFNNQQKEEILTIRNRAQSNYDLPDEQFISGESLWQQLIEPFNPGQQKEDKININVISQEIDKSSKSFQTIVPTGDQLISPNEIQQSSSSSTSQTNEEDQLTSTQIQQIPSTPPELQSSSYQRISPTNNTPFAFELLQSSPQQTSSRTSSISAETSLEVQKFSPQVASSIVPEYEQPTTSDVYQPSSRTSSISSKKSSDIHGSLPTATTPIVPEYKRSTSDIHQSPSTSPQEHQPSSRTSSIDSKASSDIRRTSPKNTTSTVPQYEILTSDIHQLPSTPPQEHQPSSRTSSIGSKASVDIQGSSPAINAPTTPEYQPVITDIQRLPSTPPQEHQPSSRTSSVDSKVPSDIQRSSPIILEHKVSTSDIRQSPPQEHQPSSRTSSIDSKTSSDIHKHSPTATASTVPEHKVSTSDIHQPSSRTSSTSSKTSLDFQKSPSITTSTVLEYQPTTFDTHQSPLKLEDSYQTSPEVEESPRINTDIQNNTPSITIDDYQKASPTDDFGFDNQLNKPFIEIDDNYEYEDSTSQFTDEKTSSEHGQSFHSIEPSSTEEIEISLHSQPIESQSSTITLTNISQNENLLESDNLLTKENKSEINQNEILDLNNREEDNDSSLLNQIEENNNSFDNISSTVTIDYNLNESNPLLPQDTSKHSSHNTSFTDVEEVDSSTSQKFENKSSDENDNPNLATIMEDLRYVFHELINDEDLVEINDDLPDRILDRLEFRDHFIRTLFDALIRKYLVQAAAQSKRPATLDWVEFRDILFPIITGRYTERNIRKLFDLFDTSRNGYLSIQEISELLEILHAHDTIDLAQNIIDEFDTDHDGKLSVEELIEAFKKTDDINEHALSEETENKQWFLQFPIENQTITLEVPIVNFPSKLDSKFIQEILLILGSIFKKLGGSSDSKGLDSNNKNLSIQIINEFIQNNINISNDDLQLFIELYLEKKRNTDLIISWIEFRDLFFPIINNGFYSKNDIKRWFEIFDINQNGMITREQIIQLLHLLKIKNTEEIINKLIDITESTNSWTYDELTFVLDSIDETTSHLLTNNESLLTLFDNNWLSKNIF